MPTACIFILCNRRWKLFAFCADVINSLQFIDAVCSNFYWFRVKSEANAWWAKCPECEQFNCFLRWIETDSGNNVPFTRSLKSTYFGFQNIKTATVNAQVQIHKGNRFKTAKITTILTVCANVHIKWGFSKQLSEEPLFSLEQNVDALFGRTDVERREKGAHCKNNIFVNVWGGKKDAHCKKVTQVKFFKTWFVWFLF